MSDFFNIERAVSRNKFPGGPNEDPGIRLSMGFLPGLDFNGLAYVHVEHVGETGDIVPSSLGAIDPDTGKIREPGVIVLVDSNVVPPRVVKRVGKVAIPKSGLNRSDELRFTPTLLM